MEVIQYVRFLDRVIPLAAAFRRPYQNFFRVDSLNVIIGINGAGKTTFLANFAECLSERDESRLTGVEYSTSQNQTAENLRFRTGPLPRTGMIFYTPLPYRREMPKSPNFVDASPRYSSQASRPKIEVFREVAASLGVATELRGTISFSAPVVVKLLFPLLTSDRCTTTDDLRAPAWAMRVARMEMQRLDDEATLDADEERLYEHYKEEFRAQEQLLQQRLLERFQTECPPDMSHPLVALASLQKLSREMGDREQLGMAFLELMNVASFAQTRDINYTRRFAAAIFATVQRTADCIPEQRLDRYAHTHSFKIDQKNERMAMRADAAVSLSWAHLPSGLLALVDQLSRLKVAATQQIKKGRTHLIILIDEGDAYLHLDWQRKYINIVNDFFGDLKDRYKKKNVTIQIVIASHSLVLAGDVANTMVTNLQEARSDVRTFAAPLDQLAFRSFKSYSVGEFATRKINLLHSKILAREIDEDDRVLIDQIGDQGVRNALIRAIDGPNTKAGDVT